MKCTYYFNGFKFDSELALDDYILLMGFDKRPISDMVFSLELTPKQEHARKVLEEAQEQSKNHGEANPDPHLIGNDTSDLDPILGKGQHIGITEMIKKLKLDNGNPVTPLFNDENYWSNMKRRLSNFERAKSEQWITAYDIPFLFKKKTDPSLIKNNDPMDPDGPYEIHDITDEAEFKQIRERMTSVWKQQALIGTAIHNVFAACLRNSEKISKDVLLDRVKAKLSPTDRHYLESENDEKLFKMIDKCIEFRDKLKTKFGDNCYIMAEKQIDGIANIDGVNTPIVGRLDLLVIDKDGNVNIIDFKCSPKEYINYNSAKKRTFMFQLESYKRMIRKLGLNMKPNGGLWVVPLKMENFSANWNTNECSFDEVSNDYSDYLLELEIDESVQKELDKVFKDDYIEDLSTNGISVEVDDFMREAFPEYTTEKTITDELVKKKIDKSGGIIKKNGKYTIKLSKNAEEIVANSEVELFKKVKDYLQGDDRSASRYLDTVKQALIDAQHGEEFDIEGRFGKGNIKSPNKGSVHWLKDTLGKYANPRYSVVEGSATPVLERYGILLVKENKTGVVNVIKISTRDLTIPKKLAKGHLLLSTFKPDIVQANDPNSLAMECNQGNIELMETMAALNQCQDYFKNNNHIVGEIQCVNLHHNAQQGLSAPNKQLLWNFGQLCTEIGKKKGAVVKNNFSGYRNDDTDGIKMCSYAQLAHYKLKDILYRPNAMKKSKFEGLRLVNLFEEGITDKFSTLGKLLKLKEEIEKAFPDLTRVVERQISNDDLSPEIELYKDILMAIAEVQGIDLTQQVSDHDNYFHELSLKAIFQEGINGNYTDNPGTLKNQNLNKLAELTARAYQNSRARITAFNVELQKKIKALKDKKNFGWIQKVTIGNQADLYQNMYDAEAKTNGELKFKDPFDNNSDLSPEERDFLQFAIMKFCEDRFNDGEPMTNEIFDELWFMHKEELLQVPLHRGSLSSQLSSADGIINVVKDKCRRLMPRKEGESMKDAFVRHTKDKLHGFFETEEQKRKVLAGEMFEMTNQFKAGYNSESRAGMLSEYGVNFFEQNLETLLLQHKSAYTIKTEMDRVFPLLKAIIVHISNQGIIQNTQFEKDLTYAYDYIKNKIFNQPIQDNESMGIITAASQELMSITSKLALAFNPKQLYQTIDGMWKDIMLIIQRPDVNGEGSTAFTSTNMKDSFMWILQDILHFGDSKTLGEHINELYGINDMDMNTYSNRITTDNAGIHNFWSLGFRFASRPDYYNRMTIFGAQMRADGCFDAHKIVDGKLVYDWKTDARFKDFAADPNKATSDPNYLKQKSLYYQMAKEFEMEGARNEDGSLFVCDMSNPKPLPRAYTLHQSESMKALSDKIYGYYAHEKKSMIQATTLGALFMQMNTFWSSKKNQYLSGHGFTQQGEYRQYIENEGKDDEIKYYQKVNEATGQLESFGVKKGETAPVNSIPLLTWHGRPQEGILITVGKLCNDIFVGNEETGEKGISYANEHLLNNENPDLRNLYRANLAQLLYDLLMFLLIGCLIAPCLVNAAEDHVKNTGNASFGNAVLNNTALLSASMLQSSADDFNAVHSILGRGAQWTPFSIQSATRICENFGAVLGGNRDTYDALINCASATRTTKPIWDFAKISTTGRKIGESAES